MVRGNTNIKSMEEMATGNGPVCIGAAPRNEKNDIYDNSPETLVAQVLNLSPDDQKKREITISTKSVSKPKLMTSYLEKQQIPEPRITECPEFTDFEYDQGEVVKLEELKFTGVPKNLLYKTTDVYMAACASCKVSPVSNFLKQCLDFKIELQNSYLSAKDVKAICVALVTDNRITSLNISGNEIGSDGILSVAEMMAENNFILELNLSGTIPGRTGLKILSKSLKKNKTLKILRLEENKIEHMELEYIIDIIENVPSIQELYLGHNKLGFEGAKMLAEAISDNATLKVLDLQWNQIRKEAAKSLCRAIGENESLMTLNLSWNGLGKEGCIELAKALKTNTKLSYLDISSNRIDMPSLRFLLEGLIANSGLRSIQLGQNPITTEGAKAVIKAIKASKCSKLEEILLEDISVDNGFLEAKKELMEEKCIEVKHGMWINGGNSLETKEDSGNELNRFDPVMVLVEYMRLDNLRVIDFFQYLDTTNSERLTKNNFRDGAEKIGIPFTESHIDMIMKRLDQKKDGCVDLEEFMSVHREVSREVNQRMSLAKMRKKEDEKLTRLRQIIKEIIENRNIRNKELAQRKLSLAAAVKIVNISRRFSVLSKKSQMKETSDVKRRFSVDIAGNTTKDQNKNNQQGVSDQSPSSAGQLSDRSPESIGKLFLEKTKRSLARRHSTFVSNTKNLT